LARTEREFLIASAGEAAGGIGWCLDATLAYVGEQGQDTASGFEHATQLCVDMVADLDRVSAAARYAWSADRLTGGPQAHRAALAAQLAKPRPVTAGIS
jgi:alkylation response protein AidB-like acyl-CoA dehydrogenase